MSANGNTEAFTGGGAEGSEEDDGGGGTTSSSRTPGADPSTADDPFATAPGGGTGGETGTFDPDTDDLASSDDPGVTGGPFESDGDDDRSGGGGDGGGGGDRGGGTDDTGEPTPQPDDLPDDDADGLTPTEQRTVENRRAGTLGGSQDPAFFSEVFRDPAEQVFFRERFEQQLLARRGLRGEAGAINLETGEVDFRVSDEGAIIASVLGAEAFDVGGVPTRLGEQLQADAEQRQATNREFGQGPSAAAERNILRGAAEDTPTQLETGQGRTGARLQRMLAGAAADTSALLETGQGGIGARRRELIEDAQTEFERGEETGAFFDFSAARELAQQEGVAALSPAVEGAIAAAEPPGPLDVDPALAADPDTPRGRLSTLLAGRLPGEGAPLAGDPVFTLPRTGVSLAPAGAPVSSIVTAPIATRLVQEATAFTAIAGIQRTLESREIDVAVREVAEEVAGRDLPDEREFLEDVGLSEAAAAAAVGGARGFGTGGVPRGVVGAAAGFVAGRGDPFPTELEIPEDRDLFGSELAIQEDPRFLPEFLLPSEPQEQLATGRLQPPEKEIPTEREGALGGPEVPVPDDPEGALGGPEIPLGEFEAAVAGQRQEELPPFRKPFERRFPSERRRERRSRRRDLEADRDPFGDPFGEPFGPGGGFGGGVVFNPGTRSIEEHLITTPSAEIDVAGIDPALARVLRETPLEAEVSAAAQRTAAAAEPGVRPGGRAVVGVGTTPATDTGLKAGLTPAQLERQVAEATVTPRQTGGGVTPGTGTPTRTGTGGVELSGTLTRQGFDRPPRERFGVPGPPPGRPPGLRADLPELFDEEEEPKPIRRRSAFEKQFVSPVAAPSTILAGLSEDVLDDS